MLDAFKTNGSSPPRGHRVREVRGQRLSTHFAAHLQRLSKDRRHEAAAAVREVAITLALDAYGADEKRAVRWLERCQIIYPAARYRSALRALVKQVATEVVGDAISDGPGLR
jgi:hypothetical protein